MSGGHDDDALTIVTANGRLQGWCDIRVTRGIEVVPSTFMISATSKFPGTDEVIVEEGEACQIMLGSDLVLTGRIDSYSVSMSPQGGVTLSLQGRSNLRNLVDCMAILPSETNTISGVDAQQLAQALCKPYGVQVYLLDATAGPAIPQFTVNLGETGFEIIERVARYAGLLVYDDTDGSMILARAGNSTMSGTLAQGINVQGAGSSFNASSRYSEYRSYRETVNSHVDDPAAANLKPAVVRDEGIKEFRPFGLFSEQYQNGVDVEYQRAAWEMQRRRGRSQVVRIVTSTWRDAAGKLWQPNALVDIDIPVINVAKRQWLISEVTYSRDLGGGTTAEITAMPPEAFSISPEVLVPMDGDTNLAIAQANAA